MGKYKAGDIVRIKTREEMDNSPDVTKTGNEWAVKQNDNILWFVEEMHHLLGNDAILLSPRDSCWSYSIFEDSNTWTIDDWMIAEKIGPNNEEEPEVINMSIEDIPKQTVNIEGIMKDDFQKTFEWLVSVGFNLDVTIVGETYKIKGEKLTE